MHQAYMHINVSVLTCYEYSRTYFLLPNTLKKPKAGLHKIRLENCDEPFFSKPKPSTLVWGPGVSQTPFGTYLFGDHDLQPETLSPKPHTPIP